MSIDVPFTKENLEYYLKELAKDFKKRGGRTRAEMILVGGASVLINYGFRQSSYDIDATFEARSVMLESIHAVADKLGLSRSWVNDDFKTTDSYTPKIIAYSDYYKTFSNVLTVRTVRAEYLVAMKLMSGRQYKKDLSDIAGILYEQQLAGNPLSYEMIDKAVCNLYGSWNGVTDHAKKVLERILSCNDLQALFVDLSENEATAKEALLEVEKKCQKALRKDNVDEVIAAAIKKKQEKDAK